MFRVWKSKTGADGLNTVCGLRYSKVSVSILTRRHVDRRQGVVKEEETRSVSVRGLRVRRVPGTGSPTGGPLHGSSPSTLLPDFL